MNFDEATARCWAEIDLDVVGANYDHAVRLSGSARVIPVLKANAYGLGAACLSRFLAEKGATLFAAADYLEAAEIRRACGRDVLVLGKVPAALLPAAVREGLIVTVYDGEMARALSEAAVRAGVPGRAHIKLDTGLHRLGFNAPEELDAVEGVFDLPGVRVEGVYTHLALRTREADLEQFRRFDAVTDALRARGRDTGLLHCCDSIGMVRYPERQRGNDPAQAHPLDAVRTGAWLYGVTPSRCPCPELCRPPLRLMTRVVQLRDVAAGEYLGYDEEHPLERDCRVATLSAGYADGYPRLNSQGEAEVHGRRAPVAGLVCMDQMTVDVTGVPGVREGDPVTLLGGGISVDACAGWARANRNELLSRVGRRVPRVYLRGGAVDSIAGPGDPVF